MQQPLALVFTEGGNRGVSGSSNWHQERARQVMGLIAAHWCEWRVTGEDIWTFKSGSNVNDEFVAQKFQTEARGPCLAVVIPKLAT